MTSPTEAHSATGRDTLAIGTYAACALVLVGSLGPWASVFGISVAGTDGDGLMTLLGALLAAGTVFLTVTAGAAKPKFKAQWITVAIGVLVALIALIDIIDLSSTEAVSVGWGIWLVLLAGAALTACGVLLAKRAGQLVSS